MATYPLEIWTLASHLEHAYTVSTWCPGQSCRRWLRPLDLPELVAQGHGDRPPRALGLRCPRCRTLIEFTIRPPQRPGGDLRFDPALTASAAAQRAP